MVFPIFALHVRENINYRPNLNPIDKLAKAITDIIFLPMRLIATLFMLPFLIPLIFLHNIIVISINTFIIFSFISLAAISILVLSEAAVPLGLASLLLISFIGINALNQQFENNIQNLFSFL